MTSDADKQLLTQQVLSIVEFTLATEEKFANPIPEEMYGLLKILLSKGTEDQGYSISNPLDLYRILRFLGEKESPTMGELSQKLSVSLSTATRVANFLEENGWAERCTDNDDARRVRLVLTDVGRESFSVVSSYFTQWFQEMLGYLTLEERVILVTLLNKLTYCMKGQR